MIVTVVFDVTMLLALRRTANSLIMLVRGVNELAPETRAALVIANLPAVVDDL